MWDMRYQRGVSVAVWVKTQEYGRICFYFFFQSLGSFLGELALAGPLSSPVHCTQVEDLLEGPRIPIRA